MPRPANTPTDLSQTNRPRVSLHRSPVGPLFAWLLLQLVALAVPIARIPFYASKSFPSTPEVIALGVMLVVQIGGAALLFPYLMRDARAALMVIAASWPFTALAGFLAAQVDQRKTPAAIVYVSLWLVALALWNSALRTPRQKGIGIAVAVLLAFGGPLTWYLSGEYGTALSGETVATLGPILGSIAIAEQNPLQKGPWLFVAAFLLASVLGWGMSRRIRRGSSPPLSTTAR